MFHILLAEDDTNLRNALSKSLQNAGYTVVPAADGKIADDRFQNAEMIRGYTLGTILPDAYPISHHMKKEDY